MQKMLSQICAIRNGAYQNMEIILRLPLTNDPFEVATTIRSNLQKCIPQFGKYTIIYKPKGVL